ncbi:MFS transporter [Lentzea albidocapillata]|uniref:Multidrug efflux pump Tap n=1 Tax=Lentzea albidocapillata TaxID=40571 RepID=A0A1W2CKD0_9PSEU|nr:MFS transporter [Lentzea albidocapillata]SMC85697.1 Predicted arabinose efflux permease, MFS family [Lentzea albidocapillata]
MTPLSRNRNYRLLWASQAVSEVGFNASLIAFPLVVLMVTGSAAASGLVLAVDAVAQLLVGLPGGVLADRWNRRRVMLWSEAAQAVAVASLAVALWQGAATLPHMVAVAAVLGACRALFEPAEDASLPRIVPESQLATAVSLNAARSSVGQMAGTALGGFLVAVGRWVPFAVDALTHALAFVGLLFLRVPPSPPAERRHFVRELLDGLKWVLGRPEMRVTAWCAMTLNLFFSAYYLVIIVLAQSRGVPLGEIGVMAAMLGAGGVVGALIAPRLSALLSPHQAIAGVFWALTLLAPLAVFISNGYLMGALFAGMALLAPTANTVITTYQLLRTPDSLRGRMSGVMNVALGTAAALGPALGGVLAELLPGSGAVLLCAGGIAVITVLVTAHPVLRAYPRKDVMA